ncbi:3-carboxy-cis,cis-muconate cycloisomerase [Kaistia dalseonensis]|uniref:3-carboxy-cis,cis-muconate cycloisomerase n=1 Tax=Kaistia dalseonensis TaxID=410840 RepID=A0ABU0H9I5_9HYPH|nr:3-carboxy-cis,cis-muconate cycloisomerase [Kaistia dalseonensis]MCX5496053.1 3-carboxy-cis,cis-muconate cycloisomerase [Kaistia dalseonensis]MDQ0438657.1 3-carboxy-cis,cis-muconate cycloisomerase [Kaistia dalseonensis]
MTATLLDAIASDATIEAFFSEDREIEAMLAFEAALAGAEAEARIIPPEAAAAIEAACHSFRPPLDALRAGMAKDGVVGPSFVALLRKAVAEPHGKWLHFGATSQDVVDTGLVLRLKALVAELDARLAGMIEALEHLKTAHGETALMAQTRMQRALPFTAADKLDTWLRPLQRDRVRLAEITPRLLIVQFGGPVGNRSGLDGKGDLIAERLAARLGLGAAPAWHTARDSIAELGGWLSLVSGTLGKIGADVALMAQNEIAAVRIAGGGSSSAMPHKSNPVAAEVLTALARYNAGLVGTLHQALVHENERSGAAWTLEWLVLSQMAITTGAALGHARQLIAALNFMPDASIVQPAAR